MLESRSHSKSGVKPEEFVVENPYNLMPSALIGWESSVDPSYMDFSEVDSSALPPATQKEFWNRSRS